MFYLLNYRKLPSLDSYTQRLGLTYRLGSNQQNKFGGSGEIRTHGAFRHDSFQDCCNKPDSATLPYLGGDYWDRTSRAIGGGFTVHCITIDASSPYCWCPGRDSNSQSLRQWLLRPPCIPFHHLGITILKHTCHFSKTVVCGPSYSTYS